MTACDSTTVTSVTDTHTRLPLACECKSSSAPRRPSTMKPRLPLPLRIPSRSYATRLPERPPFRARDPLADKKASQPWQPLADAENTTFIHRPPPSAPSPLSYTTAPASPLLRPAPAPVSGELPPTVRQEQPERERVSDADLARIRQLRREDPKTWTRGRLAREFGCSPWFVGQVTSLKGPERRAALAERDREHAANREKWGERRSLNDDIRKKRKEFW